MYEPELVDGVDGQDAFCHVETGDVLAECVVLDQHGHEISTGEKFHEKIEILRVLERIEELDDPRRVGLGKHVALSADVGKLWAPHSLAGVDGMATWNRPT
jgi:hypothetical protein